MELTARWPVDINKRMNAGYHGKCGQLRYYCTPAKSLQVTSITKLENKEPRGVLQIRGCYSVYSQQ